MSGIAKELQTIVDGLVDPENPILLRSVNTPSRSRHCCGRAKNDEWFQHCSAYANALVSLCDALGSGSSQSDAKTNAKAKTSVVQNRSKFVLTI